MNDNQNYHNIQPQPVSFVFFNLYYSDHLMSSPISCSTFIIYLSIKGAICNSVVRVFAHGAIGRVIDLSWWTHGTIYRSSQCSMTGVTKAVVCAIMSVGWCI